MVCTTSCRVRSAAASGRVRVQAGDTRPQMAARTYNAKRGRHGGPEPPGHAPSVSQLFSASQLVVSVLIGAVAGLPGAISLGIDPDAPIPVDKVVARIGIGYAGADFIDAFMAKAGAGVKPPPEAQTTAEKDVVRARAGATPSERDAVG